MSFPPRPDWVKSTLCDVSCAVWCALWCVLWFVSVLTVSFRFNFNDQQWILWVKSAALCASCEKKSETVMNIQQCHLNQNWTNPGNLLVSLNYELNQRNVKQWCQWPRLRFTKPFKSYHKQDRLVLSPLSFLMKWMVSFLENRLLIRCKGGKSKREINNPPTWFL